MVQKQTDKSELLKQLRIDKSQPELEGVPMRSVVIFVCISVMAGFFLGYWLIPRETVVLEASSGQNETPNTSVASAEKDMLADVPKSAILNASGYINARLVATVSAQVLGLITSVDVEEGMAVQTGQILARLDDSVAKVDLDLAMAQVRVHQTRLKSLQADLDEANRVLRRVTSLGGENFSSEAELTRARADLDKSLSAMATTRADIEVAKLQVLQQKEQFDKHTIRAPFAGVVTVKNAQPGEIVSPSSAGGGFTRTGICTIVDMNSLEIEVDVNEAFIGRVYPQQKVIANLDAYPNWDIDASVIAIIPTADRAKATVSVRIKIEKNDPRILPDMGVKVAFL